jgi:hypothetical protein
MSGGSYPSEIIFVTSWKNFIYLGEVDDESEEEDKDFLAI